MAASDVVRVAVDTDDSLAFRCSPMMVMLPFLMKVMLLFVLLVGILDN